MLWGLHRVTTGGWWLVVENKVTWVFEFVKEEEGNLLRRDPSSGIVTTVEFAGFRWHGG